MSNVIEDYKPPYAPAERIFLERLAGGIPAGYKDRAFLISMDDGMGYWKRVPSTSEPGGFTASGYTGMDRSMADVFPWETVRSWTYEGRKIEMLPGLSRAPLEPTESERDIKWEELGKLAIARFCIAKDAEGKYYDKKLNQVVERKLAKVMRVGELFGSEKYKSFTFELLVPVDAATGGPALKKVVCYAEAQRQEGSVRFLVKTVKPNASNGYSYCSASHNGHVSRSEAHLMDGNEMRRRFDDTPKAGIIIEMLAPQPISKITDFFTGDTLRLIQAAPKNESVKGFMLSKLMVMPPAEADTYEKLKEWIEWNVSSKNPVSGEKAVWSTEGWIIPGEDMAGTAPLEAPTVAEVALTLQVRRRQTAYGRCDYSVRQVCTEGHEVTVQELTEIAGSARSWSEFRDAVRHHIHRNPVEDELDYIDDDDSMSHGGYEQSNTDNRSTDWRNATEADEALKAFMLQHQPDITNRLINR